MRRVLLAVIVALVFPAAAAAWTPGTPYLVSEKDINKALEKRFDFAYCDGIPRFGHAGDFPYETFRVFDCDLKRDRVYCVNYRIKSVKDTAVGRFRLKTVRAGDCY